MPKRIPTPPPADDDPKYLTVVQSFPLAANWEVLSDIKDFARWIACCIGPEPFYAFFYKPSAAMNMVILEVERSYNHFDRILGEHRWSEFLKDPNREERDRVSQIFYCHHKSDREAQKDGWKRINVEDSWFKDWSPSEWRVVNPYPSTHWCDLPREDRTNKSLCRPLPVQSFPPPMKTAPPVVGSPGWVNARNAPSDTLPKAQRSALAMRPPGSLAVSTQGNKSRSKAKKSASRQSDMPSSTASSNTRSSTPSGPTTFVWASPTGPIPMEYPSPASNTQAPAFPPGLGPSPATNTQAPAFPPGLGPKPAHRPSSGACGATVNPQMSHTAYPVPPGLGINPNIHSSRNKGRAIPGSLASSNNPNLNVGAHSEGRIYLENEIYGMEQESPVPGSGYVAPWEQPEAGYEVRWGQGGTGASESLWDDYDAPARGPEPVLCNVHKLVCKRGICMEYDKQMKAIERPRGDSWKSKDRAKEKKGKGRAKEKDKGRKHSNNSRAGASRSPSGSGDGWDSESTSSGVPSDLSRWGSDSSTGTNEDKKRDVAVSVAGSTRSSVGRARSPSASSQAESVAPSDDGWDDASAGPW